MTLVILAAISLILGLIGVWIGIRAFRRYHEIIRSTEDVSVANVLKLSVLMALSTVMVFFTILVIPGSIMERKSIWTPQDILGVIIISVAVGTVVFFGSTYQIFTTIKYRDWLRKRGK